MSTSALSDCELIERFLTGECGDAEDAFEVLVTRHGPAVLEVSGRILKRCQDVEDAFQETFLALARKAGTIQHRLSLANWLYQVAYRTAIRMRAQIARHRAQLGLANHEVSPEEAEVTAARNELRPILDAELDRLPVEYRKLVEHCYLEGKTTEEAARLLGCPVGTVKGRMWRVRGLLRQRLSKSVL
jgi:RNA polymerase sigma-70 factor (ECF subfamily)